MKKILIASAIAATVAAHSAFADYEVYGKANLGIMNVDDGTDSTTDLKSFASRVGVKGKTELSEGLNAIYKWEVQVAQDGESSELKQRNQFLGLTGGFGTVIAGIHDTPMKQAEGKIDLFSDIVDIAGVQDPYMDTQEREKNYIGYYSPTFSGAQFQLATMPGKGTDLGDAFSTALVYGDKSLKKTPYFAAIAYDSGVDASEDSSAIRVSGQTKVSGFKVGAIIEQADNGTVGTDKQTRYVLSGAYKMAGNNTLLLQYANSEDADAIAGSTDTTIGLSHKLAKSTSVYGAISKGDNVGGVKDANEDRVFVGVSHKFKF
ncbi:MAG: Porin [uncultured Thiotrichaceae bacterium]|uniref:Porin n=1 Tax=uncultured Thiotrichaceae bacterium TaxID=298394 RepID=A0A6S6SW31_9GAMM|nr:MAG: Porin [uncultured Thiotrichaceae bacterium]